MSIYGLDVHQFRLYIVRPVQTRLSLQVIPENLIIGTALQESRLTCIRQLGQGPAIGVCQMEGATHLDIWQNFLKYQPELRASLVKLAGFFSGDQPDPDEMAGNINYAVGMCFADYYRATKRTHAMGIPSNTNAQDMAQAYKTNYNGPGKATVEQALPHFQYAVANP